MQRQKVRLTGRAVADVDPNLGQRLELWSDDDRPAVDGHSGVRTYREFCRAALAAAAYFQLNNIKKVMLTLPQGFDAYAITWGAYLAGTVFCPTSVELPNSRLAHYRAAFDPDLMIGTEAADRSVESRRVLTSCDPGDFEDHAAPATNAAYVMFTSGSTGRPKGVAISRESLHNVISWGLDEYQVNNTDVWGQFSSLGFDLSVFDIFTAFAVGATVVPYHERGDKLFPATLIREKRITVWHSVPSVIDLLSTSRMLNMQTMASIRTSIFCGERLFPHQVAAIFEANPKMIVYNTYGPTETTILCSFVRVTKENIAEHVRQTVSIGRPISNTELLLDAASGRDPSELTILGMGVGLGYVDGERGGFQVPEAAGAPRRYRTGDLCEYVEGKLYFVTRQDSQIKVLGNRVDLSEIDFELRNAGCAASSTVSFQNTITSFVVAPASFTADDLFRHLAQSLPQYYLPQRILFLDSLPYNSSGKIDVQQLQDLAMR